MAYRTCKMYEEEAEKILHGIRVADCMNFNVLDTGTLNTEETAIIQNVKELTVSDVLTCSYCNITFVDGLDQRNHYKLDWHRYNLKRALSGNKSVPEEIFLTLADDISSISGSDTENSEDTDVEVNESVKKFPPENFRHRFRTIRHTKAFFENQENEIFSVYRCLLHGRKENPMKDELLSKASDVIKKPKRWMIIMLGGGHFAAAIFDNGVITNHKTFHCYTVRAKQGGSQSARDNKGGNHPKSAGASLRRYNEQALIQHVQEIVAAWSEQIKQCSLLLYRATGPYNRGALFGGKNPPLIKTDPRLRNIPFPTRRATFNEVKRVHDMLSTIEVYGSADDFKENFPQSPNKKSWSPKLKGDPSSDLESGTKKETTEEKIRPQKRNRAKERSPPQREIPGENIKSPEESGEDEGEFELISDDINISFKDLIEYEDTVPEYIKQLKIGKKVKKKKSGSNKKGKLVKTKRKEEFDRIHGNLVKSCMTGDHELLMENLNVFETLPERNSIVTEDEKPNDVFTKEDFVECLNTVVSDDTKNTVLHLAALGCLPEFITLLLTAGADPTIKNKNKLTPYVIADKETRKSFRLFAASFPDKYDFKKANVPEPMTEEMEKELEEKKKEKKKLKRMKEKIKKQEDKEKKKEEEEKEKFLALSDREKCALAAERRLLASSTANLKSAKPPVLSRCFQCGVDITGKVPFEYGNNRFCTIPCLKAHRAKTNSYGLSV